MPTIKTLLETHTSAAADDVLQRARRFFSRSNSIYTAYVEKEGPQYLSLRGQGGEELIIHAAASEKGTRVTASSYLFDAQIRRFFATLPPVMEAQPA